MDISADLWLAARDFFERGGGVLLVIGLVILTMWTLILSRWIYLRQEYRADVSRILTDWINWKDQDKALWTRLKAQAFGSVAFRLNRGLPLIRTLAAICPLLGLLGTVVGMITIFQAMGTAGSGSARVVAAGVSTAMVTTMAGMVGALSGIFPANMLARRARAHLHDLQSASRAPAGLSRYISRKRPMRLKRWLLAPAGAFAMTFILVVGMEQMILIGRDALSDQVLGVAADFIRIERNESVKRKEKPEKPPEPEELPDLPDPQLSASQDVARISFIAPPVTMRTGSGSGLGGLGFGRSDGEYLPIVKVAPIYPQRAAARSIEGFVVVEYTVTAQGDTADIVVIESSNDIFNVAAIESARKYKYRPRIINGTPVNVVGVRTRIIFELED
jgi:protein TonB